MTGLLDLREPLDLMGAGRKAGPPRKSFIGSVLDTVETFYEKVVQEIDEWRPPVPKRKVAAETEAKAREPSG